MGAAPSALGRSKSQAEFSRNLDGLFHFLGNAKGDFPRSLDFDGFARRRIASHARWAVSNLHDAEPVDANLVALLQVLDGEIDKSPNSSASFFFGISCFSASSESILESGMVI